MVEDFSSRQLGTDSSVLIRGVASFQGLNPNSTHYSGAHSSVLIRGVIYRGT